MSNLTSQNARNINGFFAKSEPKKRNNKPTGRGHELTNLAILQSSQCRPMVSNLMCSASKGLNRKQAQVKRCLCCCIHCFHLRTMVDQCCNRSKDCWTGSIKITSTLPETDITPENGWLEDTFLLGYHVFRCYVSFRGYVFVPLDAPRT